MNKAAVKLDKWAGSYIDGRIWNTQTCNFSISGKKRQVVKKILADDSVLVFYLAFNHLIDR